MVVICACADAPANGLRAKTPDISADLRAAVAFGDIRDLDNLSPRIDKPLFLRLLSAPDTDVTGCVPETSKTCAMRYFLTVSTYDEYPDTAIYPLELSGEITDIAWLETDTVDTARLSLTHQLFLTSAVARNPDLDATRQTTVLRVTPDGLTVESAN